jgi:hypothetical protein
LISFSHNEYKANQIIGCGDNSSGQICIGKRYSHTFVPTMSYIPDDIVDFCKPNPALNTLVMTTDNNVYAMGSSEKPYVDRQVVMWNKFETLPFKQPLNTKLTLIACSGGMIVRITDDSFRKNIQRPCSFSDIFFQLIT